MCDPGCDRPDAYSEKVRKARKDHRCCACHETIRKGDRYFYTSGIWDGRPESYKHCIRCMEMVRWLETLAEEPPVLTLDCGYDFEDTFGGPPPDGLAHLAFLTPDEMQARVP